jgi:hypothetical protein
VTRAALCADRGTAFRPARAKAASRGIPLAAALQIRRASAELGIKSFREGQASACPDEQTLVSP